MRTLPPRRARRIATRRSTTSPRSGSTSSASSTSTRLEPGRQGRLHPVQELPGTRPQQLDLRMHERAEAAPLVPFGKTILDLDAGQARAEADRLAEGRRRPRPADPGDRRRRARPSKASLARKAARKRIERQPGARRRRGAAEHASKLERLLRRLRPALCLVDREPYKAADRLARLCGLAPRPARRLGDELGARACGAGGGSVEAAEAGGVEGGGLGGGGGGEAVPRHGDGPRKVRRPRATARSEPRDRRQPDRPRRPCSTSWRTR